MSFSNFWSFFLLGAGGALAMELLKLYDYRGKLAQKRYKALFSSRVYWLVVLGMLLASGFIAWAVNAGLEKLTAWHIVITGIGARSVIRDALSAGSANAMTKLGGESVIRDIFS